MTENATSVDRILSLRHPQNGISYVMSCTLQKTVEKLAGGKKFSIIHIRRFHKRLHMYGDINNKDTRIPVLCFCGGKASVCVDTYEEGDPTVYYVKCRKCSRRLMAGETSIAFKCESEAITAWDIVMSGERING